MLNELDFNPHESKALKHATHIVNNGIKKYIEVNPFLEYLWSIQMNELLQSYKISAFEQVKLTEEEKIEY
ncbi:hypothetical protein AWM70_21585 [Paenibacillus yonginensis]|uniref:Uncharacterized protein n=1 Tax=Paenibacillus yonginensis TaxID=1462996 RepID=A0A1B1N612_9BACL|nr:hypothetical protein [Paenibacillus yonginensis]ANS76854.1 hypothetical protein AWM70_21585 [Paenibacillus yonginensis]